jgi:uncharacterized membrane protein YedE/YeeE
VRALKLLPALIAGAVFSIGLGIGGMTRPELVVSFLSLGEGWNPRLAFVLIAAVVVYGLFFYFGRSKQPVLDSKYHLPSYSQIDRPLILGAVLFGLGWGLVGYCPGPAVGALATGHSSPMIFVVSMVAGMQIYRRLSAWFEGQASARAAAEVRPHETDSSVC